MARLCWKTTTRLSLLLNSVRNDAVCCDVCTLQYTRCVLMSLSKLVGRVATLFGWLACATLLVIMATTFTDVIGRTFFGRALVGTVETVELLMGVLVFSGLALTEIHRRHIAVETFQSLFPPAVKRLSVIVNLLLAVFITALLARQLIIKTIEIWQEQEHTQILELPYWPTAIIMSAGIVLFLLILLLRLIETVFKSTDKQKTKPVDPDGN